MPPEELTERLTGMIAAYVPDGEDDASGPGEGAPPAAPAPVDPRAPGADEDSPAAVPGGEPAGAEGPGTVVLGFADGSTVALEPGDSRTRPFLTLTDALTSR